MHSFARLTRQKFFRIQFIYELCVMRRGALCHTLKALFIMIMTPNINKSFESPRICATRAPVSTMSHTPHPLFPGKYVSKLSLDLCQQENILSAWRSNTSKVYWSAGAGVCWCGFQLLLQGELIRLAKFRNLSGKTLK